MYNFLFNFNTFLLRFKIQNFHYAVKCKIVLIFDLIVDMSVYNWWTQTNIEERKVNNILHLFYRHLLCCFLVYVDRNKGSFLTELLHTYLAPTKYRASCHSKVFSNFLFSFYKYVDVPSIRNNLFQIFAWDENCNSYEHKEKRKKRKMQVDVKKTYSSIYCKKKWTTLAYRDRK